MERHSRVTVPGPYRMFLQGGSLMIRRCLMLVACALFLSGCALPGRSVVFVSTDTLVCVPPTVTVVHTEYRTCGNEVPVEVLAQAKPAGAITQLVSALQHP